MADHPENQVREIIIKMFSSLLQRRVNAITSTWTTQSERLTHALAFPLALRVTAS
jgi:hypothetical protein